jgi:hypothetical protein
MRFPKTDTYLFKIYVSDSDFRESAFQNIFHSHIKKVISDLIKISQKCEK